MSAIEKIISQATGLDPKRGEERQAYLGRLVVAVSKLPDAAWAKLGKPAQQWYNDAADVKMDKPGEPLPDFPDAEKPKTEDKPARRRRAEDDEPAGNERLTKVGDTATVRTKRGKEYTGEVVEISDAIIVLKGDDGEDEFDMDKVESVTVLNGDAGGDGGEDATWEPSVGDEVELTTKRGKKYAGEIVEIDDKIVVLKGKDGEDEFDMDKVGSIDLAGGAQEEQDDGPRSRRSAGKEPEVAAGRRAADDKGADDKGADDGKKTRSSNPRGVSVGGRIRELMCEDLSITQEEIAKVLKKEAIEFRDTSLNMIFKDTTTVFELLRANKKMK